MCDIAEMYLKTVEITKDRPYERSYENRWIKREYLMNANSTDFFW